MMICELKEVCYWGETHCCCDCDKKDTCKGFCGYDRKKCGYDCTVVNEPVLNDKTNELTIRI